MVRMRGRTSLRRLGVPFLIVALLALGGVGTGAALSAPSSSPTLTVGVGVVDPAFTQLWLAQIRHYFAAQKLNVKIQIVGANGISLLVAGKVDLVMQGSSAAMVPVNQGIQTSIIYAETAKGGSAYAFAHSPSVRTIQRCDRVSSSQVGTSSYAWATIENKLFNAGYNIIPTDTSAAVAALASGTVDCSVGAYSTFAGLVANGQAHVIVDPTNTNSLPVGFANFVNNANEGSVFGLKANLQKKRALVVKFLRGYQKALKETNTGNPRTVANVLKTSRDWQSFDTAALADGIKNKQFFNAPRAGFLPASAWPNTLEFLIQGGETFIDLKNRKWSYAQRVDMSYYKAATAPVTQVKKK